jgi:hypothetical protein
MSNLEAGSTGPTDDPGLGQDCPACSEEGPCQEETLQLAPILARKLEDIIPRTNDRSLEKVLRLALLKQNERQAHPVTNHPLAPFVAGGRSRTSRQHVFSVCESTSVR